MKTFQFNIVTPEREALSVEAEMVKLCLPDGEYVLLAGHEPVTCALEYGLIQYRSAGGELHEMLVAEGFAQMRPDRAVIFTGQCVDADNLDRAEEKLETQRMIRERQHEQSMLHHQSASIFLTRTMASTARSRRKRRQKPFG